MKAYEEYKDSGVEWIGEIPEHWKISKLGNLGIFTASGIDKKTNQGEPLVKMVNYTDVYGNKSMLLNGERNYMVVSCPKSKTEEHLIKKGDLIFTPSSETIEDIGLSALVDVDFDNTVYSYHVIRLRFSKELAHRFKKYLCNNHFVLNQFSKEAKGTTRQILNRNVFKSIIVFIPPIIEQTIIGDYLDKHTEQIDSLIDKRKKMIELLQEERTAVINHAVTKGINPKAKMKDSGVEWIGEIPEGWGEKKLKYLVEINNKSLPDDTDSKFEFYYIDISNATEENDLHQLQQLTFENAPSRARRLPEKHDTIISTVRTYLKTISFIEDSYSEKLVVSTGFAVLHPLEHLDSKFLFYLVESEPFIQKVVSESKGIAYPAINSNDLKNFMLWYPPISEQQQIVKHIKNETSKIDKTLSQFGQEIALLQEYKTALISEAVTGKIDVREEGQHA